MSEEHGTPYLLLRVALLVGGGLAGYGLAERLVEAGWLSGSINLLYLALLGILLGLLIGRPLARRGDIAWRGAITRAGEMPADVVLAAGTGATIALLIAVLLNNVLASVPGFTWYWSLLIAALLVGSATWFFVGNRRLFPFLRVGEGALPGGAATAGASEPGLDKLVDTSAIIDGRLAEVAAANFLEGRLLVPRFVLSELQSIADADDPLRRKRGRRGLEVLDRLVELRSVDTVVIAEDPEEIEAVDDKLIHLCLRRGAALVTTDYNLNRVAALQGVRVLNVNQLANAVKAAFLPGERLSLSIVKRGREPGQGLAYLEDGTMVVVEDAAELVGHTVDTVVTSNLQTNMGRMIFARPDPPAA